MTLDAYPQVHVVICLDVCLCPDVPSLFGHQLYWVTIQSNSMLSHYIFSVLFFKIKVSF